ncbi:ABC transporter type 1, transmembrane domain-containing protein, partial [Entophlyctis helioformis]
MSLPPEAVALLVAAGPVVLLPAAAAFCNSFPVLRIDSGYEPLPDSLPTPGTAAAAAASAAFPPASRSPATRQQLVRLAARLRTINGAGVLLSIVAAVLSAVSLYLHAADPAVVLVPHILNLAAWLALVGVFPVASRTNVAFEGGFLSVFLALLLIIASHALSISSVVNDIIASGAVVSFPAILLGISPEGGASVISRLTFSWLNDLVALGNRRPLEQEDVWDMIDGDKTETLIREFNELKMKHKNASLLSNLITLVLPLFIFQTCTAFLSCVLIFAGPFFLFRIVSHIQDPATHGPAWGAWVHLAGLFASSMLKSIIDGQLYFTGRRVGTRMRSVLIAELYNKSLHRAQGVSAPREGGESEEDDGQASLGKIVTLMSVDTERIRNFVSYSHHIFMEDPLSVIFAIWGLFGVLGWSAMAGVALILIFSPIASKLGSASAKLQEDLMSKTDKRINIINEMLQGIRIIKYLAWENHFAKQIAEARAAELTSLFHLWGTYIGLGNIGSGSGLIVAFGTFAVYTLVAGKTLDAATAFTAINLLRVVSQLLSFLPSELMQVYKAKVSIDRIAEFLAEPDLEKYVADGSAASGNATDADGSSDTDTVGDFGLVIGFRAAKFSYFGDGNPIDESGITVSAAASAKKIAAKDDGKGKAASERTPLIMPSDSADEAGSSSADAASGEVAPAFVLRDVDIEFPVGGLSVICGSTGSGKSSLILALLGEMRRLQGRAYIPDSRQAVVDPVSGLANSVAYAAQSAWLLNATIRENILFGQPYDEQRYREVVHACALAKDFETLDGGDLTEIGEKGINVSGGQKQRIALARAAYSPASFVLLDDPLSAVDAPTARHLLKQCILGAMRGRTVVLVSHAVSLVLPYADYACILKNGEVLCQGTPLEMTQNIDAEGIFGLDLTIVEEDEEEAEASAAAAAIATGTAVANAEGTGRRLVEDEEKATGSVRFAVYKSYFFAAGGFLYSPFFLLTFFLVSGANLANDWWLKSWTDHNTLVAGNVSSVNASLISSSPSSVASGSETTFTEVSNGPDSIASAANPASTGSFGILGGATVSPAAAAPNTSESMFYVGIYAIFGLTVILANNIQLITVLYGSFTASRRVHDNLLEKILHAPLRFFEITPVGRILNRFSKDIENLDNTVIESIENFVARIIQGVTIISIIGSITPPFLVIAIPIMGVYMMVSRMYLNTSRELKRLESVSRSPIYAQFSETLAGVATIRAYGSEDRFIQMNNDKVDLNHRSFFYIWAANRWLCLRTDMLSAVVVLCAGLAVISGGVSAGWAALTITYSLDFTNALLWTVRMHAEMEMNMNSVERVQEYMQIEQEPASIVPDNRPAPEWPSQGRISVKDVKIRYAPDLPDVLKGISFEVKTAEKVAVVGRTGAGKSTLSLAFFRIVPLAGGSIEIDDMDISEMGLYDLRSRLTIIPQDPVLFAGTLRSNLDPLGEHDDAALWTALRRDAISSTAKSSSSLVASNPSSITLDFPVSENGANFSQGQPPAALPCTGNTIREEFVLGTVICIAHACAPLSTMTRCSCSDKGYVSEYGSPIELIENSTVGTFRRMCEETGEYEEL